MMQHYIHYFVVWYLVDSMYIKCSAVYLPQSQTGGYLAAIIPPESSFLVISSAAIATAGVRREP